MKAKVLTISEIEKDNPMLCLSPLRFTDECHKCQQFKRKVKTKGFEYALKMKCKPRVTKEIIEKYKKHLKLQEQIKKLKEEIGL